MAARSRRDEVRRRSARSWQRGLGEVKAMRSRLQREVVAARARPGEDRGGGRSRRQG